MAVRSQYQTPNTTTGGYDVQHFETELAQLADASGAAAHNGLFRGKDLTAALNAGTVAANGAKIRIVKGAHDITAYLDLPDPVGGTVDLTKATVKDEIAKEPLDTAKGAKIDLNATSPTLPTSKPHDGLTYTLREGAELQSMQNGDTKLGDGQPWTPKITVKGGPSGFYTIRVTK